MLGMPSQRLDLLGSWFYGDTELQFQDGRLVAVANPGALAVVPPANPDLELREGMTKAEIAGALGMPTHRMDAIGVWYYGDSELTFVGDGLIAVANAGNLRVAGPRGVRAEGVRTTGVRAEPVRAATGGQRAASQRPVPVSARSSTQPRPGRSAASGGTGAGSQPTRAENGDLYNVDNDGDGRVEPTYVRGYFRKDGTYVRGHYRARSRK